MFFGRKSNRLGYAVSRSRNSTENSLRVPALALNQKGHVIYLFAVDGKRVHDFAAVSRIQRTQDSNLEGYQRPEVQSHIRAIRRYLESDGALLPNALVVALDERASFEALTQGGGAGSVAGTLVIPVNPEWNDADKPAWLVDGQQRAAALRDAEIQDFPVPIVAFVARSEGEQRAQFILVNNTKPLPAGLIHELLPETPGELPTRFAKRRLPSQLLSRLNIDEDSPFFRRISTPTEPQGEIKDNSVLKMIENSLYDGALYQYRDAGSGLGDDEQMLAHLKHFWRLVAGTFPDAWQLPPRKSRLTHGVGIQSMGFVMDALTESTSSVDLPGLKLDKTIFALTPYVAWTEGVWSFEGGEERKWNGVQNTPTDIRLVTNHLVRAARHLNARSRGSRRR
jgi:DGQHR domain-containing protein